MSGKKKKIYPLNEFMRKYKFIPKPVITQDHKWMLDEYIWYCMDCDMLISKPAEIRKEIFAKAFPILVIGKNITYIDDKTLN